MPSWKIIQSDICAWTEQETGKFHAVLCDPPYGLEFMGKEWDAPSKMTAFPRPGNIGGFADGNKSSFSRQGNIGEKFERWAESIGHALMPVLYPGALVFMFAGTRMWHRLASGMEDAGFELWDTIMWIHGQGFPKAQAIDKLIDDKMGGAERNSRLQGSGTWDGEASRPSPERQRRSL